MDTNPFCDGLVDIQMPRVIFIRRHFGLTHQCFLAGISNVFLETIKRRNGDILEQWANNRGLFKRDSKVLYTIANGISPYV